MELPTNQKCCFLSIVPFSFLFPADVATDAVQHILERTSSAGKTTTSRGTCQTT